MLFDAPLEARERGEDQRGHGDKLLKRVWTRVLG